MSDTILLNQSITKLKISPAASKARNSYRYHNFLVLVTISCLCKFLYAAYGISTITITNNHIQNTDKNQPVRVSKLFYIY